MKQVSITLRFKKSYDRIDLNSLISDILLGTKIQFIIRNKNVILTQYENIVQDFSLKQK